MLHLFLAKCCIVQSVYKTDQPWTNQYKNFYKNRKKFRQWLKKTSCHLCIDWCTVYNLTKCPFLVFKLLEKICVQKHIMKAHSTIYNTLQSLELMFCPWKANVFTILLEEKPKPLFSLNNTHNYWLKFQTSGGK